MLPFYPPIEPSEAFHLSVTDGHSLYVERSGTPDGIPVLYLHGGPGGGSNAAFRQLFDPNRYQIIIFDQRGAGRSLPHASLEANTLPHLIEDIERVRERFGIERWIVTGGSWGSTLSIAYAQQYPERVDALVLRGLFLCRPSEIHWMYQHGASEIFPDIWERYLAPLTVEEREDCLTSYYKRLTSPDEAVRMEAARAWSCWEFALMSLVQDRDDFSTFDDGLLLAMARIECHYFVHNIFLENGVTLLNDMSRIAHIPTTLIQGRYDVVCPTRTAWDVHKALPLSELFIIPDAGHSFDEPGIVDRFIQTTDRLAALESVPQTATAK